jgi:pyruvate dehydrogenase E2 component (dihydrolipoamide acetyltransferase)
MSELTEIRVPDMGNFKDVAVIDVLVKPGDTIENETPLLTLETDKATMDVPSSAAGVVERVLVTKGGTVNTGDVVVTLRGGDGATAPSGGAAERKAEPEAPAAAPSEAAAEGAAPAAAPSSTVLDGPRPSETAARPEPPARTTPPPAVETSATADRGQGLAHASPSVRRFARELGVDLAHVTGTGFKSRVTHDDVKGYVKRQLAGGTTARAPGGPAAPGIPPVPVVDFAQYGPVEVQPLQRIQRISAARLQASWLNIPHVTQHDEADITDLEDVRVKLKQKALQEGIKLTPLAFVMRACVRALHEFPQFNSSLDASGENLVVKNYIHIGFAADTPKGLLVPVVRDADRKDVYELARSLADLSEKARTGKISAAEMQGGSFTISSLGGIGGTAFTPIVNAPEVAILGVSRSSMRPVFKDGGFVPRLILPLSLSYDHRVIDGAAAVRFTTFLAETLADPRLLTEAVP